MASLLGTPGRALCRVLLPVGLAFFALGSDVRAQKPNLVYRHPVHKFSLRVFRDWDQVPLPAGEEIEVAKFYDASARSYRIRPELLIVRNRMAEATTGVPAKDRSDDDESRLRSAFDVTLGRYGDRPGVPTQDDFEVTQSVDSKAGREWVAETELGNPGDKDNTLFARLATFHDGVIEYGIYMTCSLRQRDSLDPSFRSIARSFRFHDDKAEDAPSIDALDDVNIDPKRRDEIESSLVRGWDVIASPKRNYIVIYNTKGNQNHLLAKIIAQRIELIREQIYEEQFPPTHPVDAVSIVRVCADKREYIAYGGSPRSAGYWNSGTEELVFYDASPSRSLDDNTIAVLYHEAFHQYIFYSVGEVAPHSWFNEGHGDYYAGARYKGGRFRIEPFDWRVPVVKNALRAGVREGSNGGYVKLSDLIGFSQAEYYAYPGICYAQGWSLIYFLREEVPRKRSYREKWGSILDVYFDTLKAEVQSLRELTVSAPKEEEEEEPGGSASQQEEPPPPPDPRLRALEKAFEGVDLEALEEAWIRATLKV